MLAFDCKNLLPEKFLMKADKATMANSIEERLPLLDKEIIEFAFTIPPRLKLKNGREKYILRKAVGDLLPPQIVSRRKVCFLSCVQAYL
jgi:asparagine synthase (glutamine-hydrolysing)